MVIGISGCVSIKVSVAAIPRTKTIGVPMAKKTRNAENAKIMMQKFADALEMYNVDCNTYPTSEQGLDALMQEPQGEPSCDNWGPVSYLKKVHQMQLNIFHQYFRIFR